MSTAGQSIEQANNFMSLQPQLVQRLKDAVQGQNPAVPVLTTAELAGVQEASQVAPALHVIYGGYRVVQGQYKQWRLAHKWLIVAVTRNVGQNHAVQVAQQEAGGLACLAIAALVGESLQGATKAVELITPPPARFAKGFQYLPAAVEIETLFTKP